MQRYKTTEWDGQRTLLTTNVEDTMSGGYAPEHEVAGYQGEGTKEGCEIILSDVWPNELVTVYINGIEIVLSTDITLHQSPNLLSSHPATQTFFTFAAQRNLGMYNP